ncbi:hypothetical protein PHLGIDRAFT_276697 [Phlebiopsis gigantea 11061_1 CR5-6]|uniref:Uncharacterized protein n=1 Tax=Phlebiopsis gigantea (strain 11061_1 CR5-6) TaxID=745531 RepID=A0A0C3S125_PHLG1|nr:hypothetical protein PHLGIDRAFT_276697 [Phlebiopsis gigantea 11061_1 CR5-6]
MRSGRKSSAPNESPIATRSAPNSLCRPKRLGRGEPIAMTGIPSWTDCSDNFHHISRYTSKCMRLYALFRCLATDRLVMSRDRIVVHRYQSSTRLSLNYDERHVLCTVLLTCRRSWGCHDHILQVPDIHTKRRKSMLGQLPLFFLALHLFLAPCSLVDSRGHAYLAATRQRSRHSPVPAPLGGKYAF